MRKSKRSRIRAAAILVVLLVSSALAGQAVAQYEEDLFVPSVRVGYPRVSSARVSAVPAPSIVSVTVEAVDPDAADQRPWKFRYLWVPGYTAEGDPVQLKAVYDQHVDELIRWDDERWSDWSEFNVPGEETTLQFAGLEDGELWLLALQVMDRDGAVSLGRGYQSEVANFYISSVLFVPLVDLRDLYLGPAWNYAPSSEIAARQPLNFRWIATADEYNGTIVSYRHGWDLIDRDDPMDPGWEVPAGLAPENFYAQERTFASGGLHYFYLRVEDNCGTVVWYRWSLSVVPYVAYEDQLPLLLIDQVVDANSGQWVDAAGIARDSAAYRNAYWHFLAEAEGVQDFEWDRDRIDDSEAYALEYSDLVQYRAVLCFARMHPEQYLLADYRAVADVDRYNSLSSYQQGGGNLFLVGDRSMDSMFESKSNYWTPFVFESTEPEQNGYQTSFGYVELPDGSVVPRGVRQYAYATVGIAALDWTSSSSKTAYGRDVTLYVDRPANCSGMKGMVLDAGFRAQHLIGPGVLADTLYTDAVIDWQDAANQAAGTLTLTSSIFPFRYDEFVDAAIIGQPTPIVPQACADGPGGLCIEPMFTGLSRFDYIREVNWAAGDTGWPQSQYTAAELRDLCGVIALEDYQGEEQSSARTNGQTYGYFSYKTAASKPSGKADAYWGFDPYRFDPEQSKRAIRWVLDYFGLQMRQ